MSRPIAVIGAGGHARVAIGALRAAGFEPSFIVDDNAATWGTRIMDVEVRGGSDVLLSIVDVLVVHGIGSNAVRKKLVAKFDVEWMTVIHPRAWIAPGVEIGAGTVVYAGAIIQPGARIGCHAIVNTASSVDHDSQLADFAHVGPGAHLSGNVRVGEGAFVGVGACVIEGRKIGEWAMVGAGAAVIRDVDARTTVVGVPARPKNS